MSANEIARDDWDYFLQISKGSQTSFWPHYIASNMLHKKLQQQDGAWDGFKTMFLGENLSPTREGNNENLSVIVIRET